MMVDLKVAYIQSDLHWENIDANLAMFEEKIWQIKEEVDCIILPEMFTTGFSMSPNQLREPMNSKTFRWMLQQAKQRNAVIMGSYIVVEKEKYFNRLIAVKPDGGFWQYDKRHLYSPAKENHAYQAGTKKLIFEWRGWKICPMICYDLRFPVFSRSVRHVNLPFEYDLVIYVASWPAPRIHAWNVLLQARAVENLCYSIGVNRTGEDPNGMYYPGNSGAYNFKGETIAFSKELQEHKIVTLSWQALTIYRNRHPFHLDADSFAVH